MCFSWYSPMSMRTIARSSSNRNSASALASSVLPTPVGPRNRNEPIGLRGSDSPARLRRIALETAFTASSWPTTRSWRACSIRMSFWTSPSKSLLTGTPVHRLTTSATSSASTSSFKQRPVRLQLGERLARLLDPALDVGHLPVADLRSPRQVAVAGEALGLGAPRLELTFELADVGDRRLLGLPAGGERVGLLLQVGELLVEPRQSLLQTPCRSRGRERPSRSRAGACGG